MTLGFFPPSHNLEKLMHEITERKRNRMDKNNCLMTTCLKYCKCPQKAV